MVLHTKFPLNSRDNFSGISYRSNICTFGDISTCLNTKFEIGIHPKVTVGDTYGYIGILFIMIFISTGKNIQTNFVVFHLFLCFLFDHSCDFIYGRDLL